MKPTHSMTVNNAASTKSQALSTYSQAMCVTATRVTDWRQMAKTVQVTSLPILSLLWANTYSSCLNKLRILQKKAIRIITQSHYLAHTDPLFSKLKLLKLDDLYKHQLGIYMYKSTKGLLPDSMSSMVIPIHNVHNHNLRNQNAYYIQRVRTNCRKFTIHFTGPIFWNTLPQQLREAVSENQFKRKLKEFLLSSY